MLDRVLGDGDHCDGEVFEGVLGVLAHSFSTEKSPVSLGSDSAHGFLCLDFCLFSFTLKEGSEIHSAHGRFEFGRGEREISVWENGKEGGRAKRTCERLNERGERREFFFFIKKIYWVAL